MLIYFGSATPVLGSCLSEVCLITHSDVRTEVFVVAIFIAGNALKNLGYFLVLVNILKYKLIEEV